MTDAPSILALANIPFDGLDARHERIARFATRLLIEARVLNARIDCSTLYPGRITPAIVAVLGRIAAGDDPVPVPAGWKVSAARQEQVRAVVGVWLERRGASAARLAAAASPPPSPKAKGRKKGVDTPMPAKHADTGPAERWQHGDHELVDAFKIDSKHVQISGTIVRRAVDTLGRLYQSGAIDLAQHDAGRRFGAEYSAAGMTLRSVDFQPKPKATAGDGYQAHLAQKRQSISKAIMALGGEGGEPAQAIIQVCGEGKSLREWALQPRPHRPAIHEKTAAGILRSALTILAAHYGMDEASLERRDQDRARTLRRWRSEDATAEMLSGR